VIANFRFSLGEALLLFALFIPQFVYTHAAGRLIEAGVYLVLTAVWLMSPSVRAALRDLFRPKR